MSHAPRGANKGEAFEMPYSHAIPKPTGAPMVAAAGITLIFAGLVTNWLVTAVGVVMALGGAVAWFRHVFPDEQMEPIPQRAITGDADAASDAGASRGGSVALSSPQGALDREALHQLHHGPRRLALPLEIHPYRTGIYGGLAGGAAMAFVACLWGIVMEGSVWLPINLLAGIFIPGIENAPVEALREVNAGWLLTAAIIHTIGSLFIGLLYTVALPMMPRRPILFGGILAPVFWTGLIWASLGIVNPALEKYISWPWFIASQFAFGLVAGLVISRFNRVPTMQFLSLPERLGVEATNASSEEQSR
ncbi:MAG: hypothetical protein KF724_00190 [Phycisphaeraceae bacterium]|nr:hypothetical protein [Phycisphaeraceae bacterium]